jgi:hypothetical protein
MVWHILEGSVLYDVSEGILASFWVMQILIA